MRADDCAPHERKHPSVPVTRTILPYDKIALQSGQLTDQHIDHANQLLRMQFTNVQGLETPLLALSSRGFSVPAPSTPTVQIHHVGNHWVTSYRAALTDVALVFDSLQQYDGQGKPVLDASLIQQLRQMYGDGQSLSVGCCSVSQQNNGTDCGIFAIGYATDLCLGLDPCCREYNVTRMRCHLMDCFRRNIMSAFPLVGLRFRNVTVVHL